MLLLRNGCLILTVSFLAFSITGCEVKTSQGSVPESQAAAPSETKRPIEDAPLPEYQDRLLQQAFQTASRIPLDPHVKDRARQQEAVVEVALELGQPKQALAFIEPIPNWRKGAGYADLALYLAQNDRDEWVQHYLDKAEDVAADTEDWRRDNIRVKIAKALTWIGQNKRADEFEMGVEASESGKLNAVKAMVADEDGFQAQMDALEALVNAENFDILKNSLTSYTEVYNRFYDDPAKREAVKTAVREAWEPVPVLFRFETLITLADHAMARDDSDEALGLLEEAEAMVEGFQWPLEHELPMRADVARLYHQAGDPAKARLKADAALALYEERGSSIVNIWRAGALRPLAEAFVEMGDRESAARVYELALEEGMVNPNSRPRAEDLSGTCRSMARVGFEPDQALWARIQEIHQGLSDPW